MGKNIKIVLITFILIFIISAIPYFKPKEITLENKKVIEDDLNALQETNDKATLIDNHEDAFKIRVAMIQSAKNNIDISTYIIHEGGSTKQIFSELIKAADRGVKVRIIADGKLGGMNKDFGKALSNYPGIEIYLYNPFSIFKISTWQTVHHEKHITVDNKYLLLGGRNFGDSYFTPDTKEHITVNDYDVFISGGSTAIQVHRYYESFIAHKETKKVIADTSAKQAAIIRKIKNVLVDAYDLNEYLNRTHEIESLLVMNNNIGIRETAPEIAYALSYLSEHVENQMILQTPYLSAHPHLLKQLRSSVDRGVEVSLITNSIASSPNYPAYSNYYKNKNQFIDTGINIYEYQFDGFHSQHGKSYIYDDILAVGSFNLDARSFFINTESIVFIKSDGLKQEMLESIARKIDLSYKVSGDGKKAGYGQPFEVTKAKEVVMYIASIFSRLFSFLV